MGEQHQYKRGPRGKYARYLCQRCRSRKIKCVLPNPDDIRPLGSPLTKEKACERCRSMGLDCIIEATVLGRPSHRRGPPLDSQRYGGYLTTTPGDGSESTVGSDDNVPSSAIPDVKEYFYTDAYHDGGDGGDGGESTTPISRKASNKQLEDTFQSMVDSTRFISSILARDEAFGSTIPLAMPRFNLSLLDLISDDMATSLDKCLGWHRFFTPQTPTLVSIRNRLMSHGSATSTCSSTNLLFALLCLIALEMPANSFSKEHTNSLVKNIQLAVSTYGQIFIFSPSTHRDSLTVSLLLANYKPAALISSQSIAHISINSEIYINIAYRVAERLNMLPAQAIWQLKGATNLHSLENILVQSSQAFQVYCLNAILDRFFIKPLEDMKQILEPLRPQVDLFRSLLRSHQCLPSVIYHTQNAIGNFIMMDAMMCIKQNWDNLDSISMIIETTEKKALEIVEFNNSFLENWSRYENHDELLAIQDLLELLSEWVPLDVCGFGIICAMASKARSDSMKAANEEPEPSYGDIAKTSSRVIDSLTSKDKHHDRFSVFVGRFGRSYRNRLYLVLEKLVSCVENLRLDGVRFQPPRSFVFKAVMLCKNIIENCLVDLRVNNHLKEDFEERLKWFSRFVERIKGMIASSPWQSVDEAFAGGCIYAASNKVAHSLYEVMDSLRDRADRMIEAKAASERQSDCDVSMEPLTDLNIGLDGWDPAIHLEWSRVSSYNVFDSLLQESFDWSSVYNIFPETDCALDR